MRFFIEIQSANGEKAIDLIKKAFKKQKIPIFTEKIRIFEKNVCIFVKDVL